MSVIAVDDLLLLTCDIQGAALQGREPRHHERIKTEIDRSEAVCGEYTQYYDEKVKTKYEVETAPLSIDEAKWLNQMLTSNLVKHGMEDGTFEDILISDITSEVSNSDKDLIRLKFSWKYADGSQWI